jgi:hypothetical protein
MRPVLRTRVAAAAAAVLLSGCANPILRIDGPGYSVANSAALSREPASMADAVQKLNHLRARYYEAILDQTGLTQNATTGLVWLGAAVAGMAAGNVSSDAILGASLIGGTSYGLARTQLDARRIQVWTEGMKALDCAKEAALPLDLGEARRSQLETALAALGAQRIATQQARNQVQAALDDLVKTPSDVTASAQAMVARTDTALVEADKTQEAALDLLQASRGGELSSTVDRIHTKVTEVMGSIAVDISSVKQMVGGIGGFAAIFAPGAGIEGLLAGGYEDFKTKNAKPKLGAEAGITDALDKAMAALDLEIKRLVVAQGRVSGLLKNVNLAGVAAALKKCDVAGVATPLQLTPAVLRFAVKGAAPQGFEISGGTPPYVVTPLAALPDGVSLQFSGGLADTAAVKVDAQAPDGELRLRVSDSGTSKRSQQLVVQVGSVGAAGGVPPPPAAAASAAPGGAVAPAAAAATAATTQAWGALVNAMTQSGFSKSLKGVTFSVAKASLVDGRLLVTLRCDRQDIALPAADVRERLSTADKKAVVALQAAQALDANFSQIDLTPSAPCVKP